jgi:hypothetical protein
MQIDFTISGRDRDTAVNYVTEHSSKYPEGSTEREVAGMILAHLQALPKGATNLSGRVYVTLHWDLPGSAEPNVVGA